MRIALPSSLRPLLAVFTQLALACGGSGTAPDRATLSVEELLDGHVHATGGRHAHARLHNRVTRGRAELRGFPDHDWTASFVRREAAPRFWSETLTFHDWENEEGTDGDVAWGYGHVKYPGLEHRLKTTPEVVDLAHLVVFNGHLSWRDRYETTRLVGTRTVEGIECHEIVLIPPRGQPVTWWLDSESLLLVKTESRLAGTIIETYPDDFREVDGVLLPHRVVRHASGGGPGTSTPFLRPGLGKQDLLLTVESIRHDVDPATGDFSVPAAIRALVGTGPGGPR